MKTFIFGTGASTPFFKEPLTTKFLTEKVCNKALWERVMAKYASTTKEVIDITPECIVSIIGKVREIMPEANFEQIAEVIDKISSYMHDCCPKHKLFNMTVYSMGGFSCFNGIYRSKKWDVIPFLFREIIAESILDLEVGFKAQNYEKLSDLQRNLFNSIRRKDRRVNIMSLNYDDCIYDSLQGLGFETGFSILDSVDNLQFDAASFMDADNVVYFPHGHLKFQFVNNVDVSFWHDSKEADRARWNNLNTGIALPSKFAYNFNTFITTGQTKDEIFNYAPYSTYYQRFAVDILKSDTLYIIGYSFGDEHINRMLYSFLKLSERNKVYVIDYSEKICDEIKNTDSHIHNIVRILSDGQLDADMENLKNNGCGELNQQVYYYGKGYKEFLEKDQDFILGPTCPFI